MYLKSTRVLGVVYAVSLLWSSIVLGDTIEGTARDLAGAPLPNLQNGLVTVTIGTGGAKGTKFFSIGADGTYRIVLDAVDDFDVNDRIVTIVVEASGRIPAELKGISLRDQTIDATLPKAELVCYYRRCRLGKHKPVYYWKSAGPEKSSSPNDKSPSPNNATIEIESERTGTTVEEALYSLREWTNSTNDKRVMAVFVRLEGSMVYFRSESGRNVATELTNLSQDDKAIIAREGQQDTKLLAGR